MAAVIRTSDERDHRAVAVDDLFGPALIKPVGQLDRGAEGIARVSVIEPRPRALLVFELEVTEAVVPCLDVTRLGERREVRSLFAYEQFVCLVIATPERIGRLVSGEPCL